MNREPLAPRSEDGVRPCERDGDMSPRFEDATRAPGEPMDGAAVPLVRPRA